MTINDVMIREIAEGSGRSARPRGPQSSAGSLGASGC